MIPFLIYFQSGVTFPLVALDKTTTVVTFLEDITLDWELNESRQMEGNVHFEMKP